MARQCAAGTIVVYARGQDLENTGFSQTTTVFQKLFIYLLGPTCPQAREKALGTRLPSLQISVGLSSVGVHGMLALIQLNSLAMLVYTP